MKFLLTVSSLIASTIVGVACTNNSQMHAAGVAMAADKMTAESANTRELPPNINDFESISRKDRLAAALVRHGRNAMNTDISGNEPWLFDRATTYYKLSLWSGDEGFRSHAFDLVRLYYSLIDRNGEFTLKPGDSKYAYVDGAVWFEFETGDSRFRPKAEAIYKFWNKEFSSTYTVSQRMWTEREIAYALGAALGWYALSRDPFALERARNLVQQWADMSKKSGAPLHTLAQHQQAFEPPWFDKRMTSPWMAALFFEYLQHYENLTGDSLASELVSNYANFLLDNCLYDGSKNHPNLTGYLMPFYLCGEDSIHYTRETPSQFDGEHTPDVMGILAYAVSAKRKLGLDERPTLNAYLELRRSAEFFVSRRSDLNPPRKINWWIWSSYDSTRLVE